MGFVRKESRGEAYRPIADGGVAHRAPDTSGLVSGPSSPASGQGTGAQASADRGMIRDARTAMLALSRYSPAPLTASERAFIELRRGCSE
jgi:hypothetical protein